MRFKLIHVFFHLYGMDLIHFVDQIPQPGYISGKACAISISIRKTDRNEKYLITLLLMINPSICC